MTQLQGTDFTPFPEATYKITTFTEAVTLPHSQWSLDLPCYSQDNIFHGSYHGNFTSFLKDTSPTLLWGYNVIQHDKYLPCSQWSLYSLAHCSGVGCTIHHLKVISGAAIILAFLLYNILKFLFFSGIQYRHLLDCTHN